MGDRRRGDPQRRAAVAREAARLMYREGVRQYFDAKRIAADRVLGREARGARHSVGELPSNGEIREALLELAALAEGADGRAGRLFAMRVTALHLLRELAPWRARLIGSVWSGFARRGSDIDLHVFAEEVGDVEADLERRGWAFDAEEVLIRVGDDFRVYHHLYLRDEPFPVELSVYPLAERRRTTRSSVSGLPIDRVGPGRLAARIASDHPDAWSERDWLAATAADLALLAAELDHGATHGEFDGSLAELSGPRTRGDGTR